MTHLTRRDLLKIGAQATTLALLPRSLRGQPLLADFGAGPVPVPPIADPDVKKLAMRAIEASRAAGATYADVRLTHTYQRIRNWPLLSWDVNSEQMHVGVRALVNGQWGFAASGIWTMDEMARLGRDAVELARANKLGKPRQVVLPPAPPIADGHWVMPVKRDPFTQDGAEIADIVASLPAYTWSYLGAHPDVAAKKYKWNFQAQPDPMFALQEHAFASTEGSYGTQRRYRSGGSWGMDRTFGGYGGLDFLSPAGVGLELYRDHDLKEAIWQLMDELAADFALPQVPLEVGRYDTVVDARLMAHLVDATLGRATELDRALGYEANATGTSYLNDPFGMIGNYPVAAPLLTLTANRSEPGGCATVPWDDDGVRPADFTLVKDGVLVDFQTTRESAGWLAEVYAKQKRPLRSAGCAAAPTALHAPLTHTPNLVASPGKEAQDFDALVGTIKNGIAVKCWGEDPGVDVDFQGLNGMVTNAIFYQVKDGRRVARLKDEPGLLFRSPELWKGLLSLGGEASARRYGIYTSKGEPEQTTCHSVTTPPAVFKQLTLIDASRR